MNCSQLEELNHRAVEADSLRDEIDEYRHAADRLAKAENTLDKYKKKLEESADVRRALKVRPLALRMLDERRDDAQAVEEQNASLLDRNAQLEDEYRKVSAFKPLMDQYKSQVNDLEATRSTALREADELRFELDRVREKLRIAEEQRSKETEATALYEDRIKELELRPRSKKASTERADDDEAADSDVDDELEDALSGTTMTGLKLQVRHVCFPFVQRRLIECTGPQTEARPRGSTAKQVGCFARRRPREPA